MMCVPFLSSGRHVQYSQPLRIAYISLYYYQNFYVV